MNLDQINQELSTLRSRLQTERQALTEMRSRYDELCIISIANPEAATEAAILQKRIAPAEARIRGLELLINEREEIKKALEDQFQAEAIKKIQERQEVEQQEKFERLNSSCRTARDLRDEAREKRRLAEQAEVRAQSDLNNAVQALETHKLEDPKRLDPFATKSEIASHQAKTTELESAVKKAMEARNQASVARSNAFNSWYDAEKEASVL